MAIIEKQQEIAQLFLKFLREDTLGHAYILAGPNGTGKKEMALWVSQTIFCLNPKDNGAPCEECAQCQKIDQHQHLDVIEIAPTNAQGRTEKQVRELIKDSDNPDKERDKHGKNFSLKVDDMRRLKLELSMSGVESAKKVIIIEQADLMTNSSANSLLKFIEEPQADLLIFLITESKESLLPTIISRSQIVPFNKMDPYVKVDEYKNAGFEDWESHIFVRVTQSLDLARELKEELDIKKIKKTIWMWFEYLVRGDNQAFVFVHTELRKVVENKSNQALLFDFILYLFEDLLILKYHSKKPIAYVDYQEKLEVYADNQSANSIVYMIESVLHSKTQFEKNVSFQACLETLTLSLLTK